MVALDSSILLYAVNRYAPEHLRAARVVEGLIQGEHPWGLPVFALIEFLQRVTHPHAVARPLRPADAWGFIDPIVSSETARVLHPGRGYAGTLGGMITTLDASGGLPLGLEMAALLKENGVRELLSCDQGMRRYPFLTVVDPVHGDAWHPAAQPRRRYRTLKERPIR